MRPIHSTALAVFFSATVFSAGTAHADARGHTQYLELVNRANESMTSFAIAPVGSDAFREVPLGSALRGGGDSATLEVAADGCVQDLRFGFRDGRTLVYQGVDICRHSRVHVQRLPHAGNGEQTLLGQARTRSVDPQTP